MTDTNTIRQIIEARFKTAWGSRTPIRWENQPFKQPANFRFVSLSVIFGKSRQMSMGVPKFKRRRCLVSLQIFDKKDKGTVHCLQDADFFATAFEGQQIILNGVNVVLETSNVVGPIERPDYFQFNVDIPFDADAPF